MSSGAKDDGESVSDYQSSPSDRDNYSYWRYATDSIRSATESTYSGLASVVSSLYQNQQHSFSTSTLPSVRSSPHVLRRHEGGLQDDDVGRLQLHRGGGGRRASAPDLYELMENPYNSVRGRHSRRTSRTALRSLLSLVPVADKKEIFRSPQLETLRENVEYGQDPTEISDSVYDGPMQNSTLEQSWTDNTQSRQVSDSETASQLAEGTIRALRDLCLDEACDLHDSLRFWTHRWERPVLSWFEAGPSVWTTKPGYSHQNVGRKVSQIQAVLARRCAAIGELQEHLLKAGWQGGVAQWGVLGQGGQWAAVVGFDGTTDDSFPTNDGPSQRYPGMPPPEPMHRRFSSEIGMEYNPPSPSYSLRDSNSPLRVMANVLVQKRDGGGIFVEDPSNLAQWSVQAVALVRQQLVRAANGRLTLPYCENWTTDQYQDSDGPIVVCEPDESSSHELPSWAIEIPHQMPSFDTNHSENADTVHLSPQIKISNLSLMVREVSELLNVMEDVVDIQRRRRLERLQPPPWFRRNWYILATVVPASLLLGVEIVRKGQLKVLIQSAYHSVSAFVKERLRDPVIAILNELWKGRENFSDTKARAEATEVLKKMIASWLADNYPQMSDTDRQVMAQAMDVSLVEKTKEESMKTFYEINNVIRMSFIEMQYMKKEMMNALGAMDEMMSANDINMNLAAITPVFLVAYVSTRVFKFLFYVFLKLGKSREEIYANIRNVLTDIDRLLVMRDRPPIGGGEASQGEIESAPCVLGRDDLGMLMLLIHECRTIMWRAGPRRFPVDVVMSVSEDLAELAGERGPVSVRQQLKIVSRMSRTYPFLQAPGSSYGFRSNHLRGI